MQLLTAHTLANWMISIVDSHSPPFSTARTRCNLGLLLSLAEFMLCALAFFTVKRNRPCVSSAWGHAISSSITSTIRKAAVSKVAFSVSVFIYFFITNSACGFWLMVFIAHNKSPLFSITLSALIRLASQHFPNSYQSPVIVRE